MAAENTDKFRKGSRKFTTTLAAPGIIDASTDTFTLANTAGLPSDTAVDITVDRADGSGTLTPTKEEVITGVVSGSNIVSALRGVEGTAQAHASGALVEVRLSASQWNSLNDGILVEHGQDGKHGEAAVSSMRPHIASMIPPMEGEMRNGKIVPTVAGNNLTLALKTLAGNDPSASDPVYITLGGAVRTITSALSVTKNAGTNWCNAGSAELATKEIDYFVYLGYNATDGVVIGFSRIPFAGQYSEFSTTTTNEKYCAISTITNASSTDAYSVIGRFAVTLSAGAGYTWSVPTYTPTNLIQRPIFEIRGTTAITPVIANVSGTPTAHYKLVGSTVFYSGKIAVTGAGGATTISFSCPFTAKSSSAVSAFWGSGKWLDAGVKHYIFQSGIDQAGSIVRFMENASDTFMLGNRAGLGNADSIEFSIAYEI